MTEKGGEIIPALPKRELITIDKEQNLRELMAKLALTREEAERLYEYDKAVDRGEKGEFELTTEQEKVSREMRRVPRKPAVYKLTKRERKPNATKGAIISALATFLAETEAFSAEKVETTNAERQIKFESAGETFELTLVQKRKPKN